MAASRTERRKSRQKGPNAIEKANAKNDEEFVADYMPSLFTTWTHPVSEEVYSVRLRQAASVSEEQMTACFNLVYETSGEDYRKSSLGWHPAAKKKEMRSPELRYVLVMRDGQVRGFASLMPAYENGEAVIYCYEIHLKDEMRGDWLAGVHVYLGNSDLDETKGTQTMSANSSSFFFCPSCARGKRTGLGRRLMQFLVEAAGRMDGVDKVMLTCFVRNARARSFYERLGFGVDVSSPRERKLRGKRVVPDYVIMSRRA